MDLPLARTYLKSLINSNLHVHTSDGRMFVGMFKCTDNERNIILSQAFEYRRPTEAAVAEAAARHERDGGRGRFGVEMGSRFIGLIVVPGRFVTKIEREG